VIYLGVFALVVVVLWIGLSVQMFQDRGVMGLVMAAVSMVAVLSAISTAGGIILTFLSFIFSKASSDVIVFTLKSAVVLGISGGTIMAYLHWEDKGSDNVAGLNNAISKFSNSGVRKIDTREKAGKFTNALHFSSRDKSSLNALGQSFGSYGSIWSLPPGIRVFAEYTQRKHGDDYAFEVPLIYTDPTTNELIIASFIQRDKNYYVFKFFDGGKRFTLKNEKEAVDKLIELADAYVASRKIPVG
jgi:hypothetical protein